ncbi:hypothetical protein TNCV_3706991 [Trichonephila clavipes]|nr:hypothetical protein TNCV_3706991 [Trichonephila clavipes]
MFRPDSPLKVNRAFQYGEAAMGKGWNVLLNKSSRVSSSLPRSVGAACFRLLTGHDYLQRHLHRIGPAGWHSWFAAGLLYLRLKIRPQPKSVDFHDAEN